MKAIIILKCDGRQDNGFRYCSGVENILLDLETIIVSENYHNLIKYIDAVIKLFDGPCFKLHIISNAIYKFVEMDYISENMYKYIMHYFEMHKKCGICMMVLPKEK